MGPGRSVPAVIAASAARQSPFRTKSLMPATHEVFFANPAQAGKRLCEKDFCLTGYTMTTNL